MSTNDLPYMIMDADNHFTEPPNVFENYIDPSKKDLAIRQVTDADGRQVTLFAGKPAKFHSNTVIYSDEQLAKMLGDDVLNLPGTKMGKEGGRKEGEQLGVVPGMYLNRLNPLKGLNEEERKAFVQNFRHQAEAFGNRDLRLALMDEQGIEAAVMYPAAAHDIEYEFDDNMDALYANVRSFNRWMYEEVGYNTDNRMYLPPYIPLADVDRSVAELETVLNQGAPIIWIKSGHAHGGPGNPLGGRSPADPVFDPIWSRINEAGVRVAVHLGGTDYAKYGADWSEDPNTPFGDFDAFQWMMYWGDRPAYELTASMILHNLFGRFPNIKVLLSELGTVWVPYVLRKMDHAFMMGRKAKWGSLKIRPSEVFRQQFLVMPYPEENVQRVAEVTGVDCLAFGSDFPHGEGLAYPGKYAAAQLSSFNDEDVRKIMRGNLAEYLRLPD